MRLIELPTVSINVSDEEILADLLYPGGGATR
jgi:hypothetical protein